MTALKVIPNKSKEDKFCMFSCSKEGMIKYAQYRVTLLDYPLDYPGKNGGYVCKDCMKTLKTLWESGLDG